ncbi:mitochondrial matrix Mmp37-domain-containing protein [Lipomyces japonicus]|uniref:mitochondrial matrix Mmp37-domain-containing protein n=1 Tax=Lipomyces japonicus TaxID=56871 RepID=UPI0034CD5486
MILSVGNRIVCIKGPWKHQSFIRIRLLSSDVTHGRSSPKQIPRSEHVAGLNHDFLRNDSGNEQVLKEITKFSQLPEFFGVNQHMPIDDEIKETLRRTLWQFKAPIRYAFAYGSSIFSQGQTYTKKPQVDMVFGVTYSQHWHSLNMSQHPDHYSFLRRLGSGAVSYIQDNTGAGVYYNPYVEINGLVIKYGVVNIDTLCRDLLSWDTLYLSGRLHKPVKILRDDPQVRLANQRNLFSVIRAALLLLPERFTEKELYQTIASISYMGDPRMNVGGENPNKVSNIVTNNQNHFQRLYAPLIDTLPNVELAGGLLYDETISDNATLVQDMDPLRRGNMVARLPSEFKYKLYSRYTSILGISPPSKRNDNGTESQENTEESVVAAHRGTEFDQRIASDPNLKAEISRAIKHTVKWASTTQSLKGILTSGVWKSIRYVSEKFEKAKASRK